MEQNTTGLRLFKLSWYLQIEERMIEKWITREDKAIDQYNEVQGALDRGCWICLEEYNEDENNELVRGETLHYCDI
mgnify:FL=1